MKNNILNKILIASALIGSGAQAQFLDAVQAPQFNTIKEIRYIGNESVADAILNSRIGIKSGDQLNPNDLRDKLSESIRNLNQTKLFQDVTVGLDYLGQGDVGVVYRVYEKPTLDTVLYEGNDNVRMEELKDKIVLLSGQAFSTEDAERQRLKLIEHYKSTGYLQADIRYSIEPGKNNKKKLVFTIAEGQKIVVSKINIFGNKELFSDDIIDALGSKVDHWWSSGEFKEAQFENDKDSLLAFAKSNGFLDAAVLSSKAEYIPEPKCHFFNGRLFHEGGLLELLNAINRDIIDPASPLGEAMVRSEVGQNPFFRRFNTSSNNVSVNIQKLTTEEQVVEFLNRILDNQNLRTQYLSRLGQTLPENATEYDSRKAVRLALEERYPVLKMSETNTSSEVILNFTMSEGRKYYASQFNFLGNAVMSDAALYSRISFEKGEVFNEKKYQQMVADIYGIYREDGYLFARIDDQKTYNDSLVNVTFNITEGKPASIRRIDIKGNTTTIDKVIRREVKLFPGDTYRQSLMERSFRDIMQLNYFEGVVPDIKPVNEQEVDLQFNVKEREAGTGQFSAGMAYTARDGLMGTLGLSIPNFSLNPFGLGGGQRIDLNVEYGATRQNYSLGYSEPWFQDRPIRVGGSVNYSKTEYSYRPQIVRKGFTLFTGSRLTWPDDYFYAQANYNLQHNSQGANIAGMMKYTGLESSLGFTLIRDDKNLPQFPTDGSRVSLSTDYAGLGGDFHYVKNDFDAKWWFPIISGLSASFQGQLGIIDGTSVQYQTLYQMGGLLGYQGKARGYTPGSIGRNRLGRSYLSMTSEITYPIVDQRFYISGFFDAGNVFGQAYPTSGRYPNASEVGKPWEEINPSDLLRDYGAGFRVIVPMIGIIGFDFAFPLDPGENSDGSREKFISNTYQMNFVIEQGF